MPRPHVLVFAGTESQGYAGLHSDLRALYALPVRVSTVVTCVTAQPADAPPALTTASAAIINQQLTAALQEGPPDAIKVGLLASEAAAQAVLALKSQRGGKPCPLVIDPVMRSSAGADQASLSALGPSQWLALLQAADLVTPNLIEAAWLLEWLPDRVTGNPTAAAYALSERLGTRVLLKGGHALGDTVRDSLVEDGQLTRFTRRRVSTRSRGTGCFLASAIAARQALGLSYRRACLEAGDQLHEALRRGLPPALITPA